MEETLQKAPKKAPANETLKTGNCPCCYFLYLLPCPLHALSHPINVLINGILIGNAESVWVK